MDCMMHTVSVPLSTVECANTVSSHELTMFGRRAHFRKFFGVFCGSDMLSLFPWRFNLRHSCVQHFGSTFALLIGKNLQSNTPVR